MREPQGKNDGWGGGDDFMNIPIVIKITDQITASEINLSQLEG